MAKIGRTAFEARKIDKSRKDGKVLGVVLSSTSKEGLLNVIAISLKKASKFFITTPNPEILVKAKHDKKLLAALNSSTLSLPDGVGVVWAAKLEGVKLTRTPGRIAMHWLLEFANSNRHKVYFLGATKEVIDKVLLKVSQDYPNIKAKGSSDILLNSKAQYVSLRDSKSQIEILNHINDFKPNILFVALGAPKQEKWIHENLDSLKIGGAMTVGGALDYYAGKMAPPPGVVSRLGLEWLWRVCLQPTRLPRIINATLVFPYLVLKDKFFDRK